MLAVTLICLLIYYHLQTEFANALRMLPAFWWIAYCKHTSCNNKRKKVQEQQQQDQHKKNAIAISFQIAASLLVTSAASAARATILYLLPEQSFTLLPDQPSTSATTARIAMTSEARATQVLYNFSAFFDLTLGFWNFKTFSTKKTGFLILFLKNSCIGHISRNGCNYFHIHEIGIQSTQLKFLMSFQESCVVWLQLIHRKCTN